MTFGLPVIVIYSISLALGLPLMKLSDSEGRDNEVRE